MSWGDKKLKLLVVDDEPDNLDLLYRTFRRDFKVYNCLLYTSDAADDP